MPRKFIHIKWRSIVWIALIAGYAFLPADCFCQATKVDSLKKVLLSAVDTAKANILNLISKEYFRQNFDSSISFARQALSLSQKLNYKRGIAEACRNTGRTSIFLGHTTEAKEYLFKALSLFVSLNDDKNRAATYNNLGVIFSNTNEFDSSLQCYDSALVLFRKIRDKEGEGSVLNYIGINYQEQGNFQKAIDYCLQGYEIRKSIQDHPGVIFSLINVGNMYLEAGQPESALNLYRESVAYAREHKMEPEAYSIDMIAVSYMRLKQFDSAAIYVRRIGVGKNLPPAGPLLLGELYYATNKLDSALTQFKASFATAQKSRDKKNKAQSLLGISKVLAKQGATEQAIDYAKQSYTTADSIRVKLVLAEAAQVLAGLYKTTGNYKESIQFFEKAHSILDSVTSENYHQKLTFVESKNAIEKQEAQVKVLSAEKELQSQKLNEERFIQKLVLILFAVAIILAFLIIRNINLKKKKIQLQKEQLDIEKIKVEKAFAELTATQSQLIQREKMASLGELTAGIAHEIQNPLNFVNNFSELNIELLEEMKGEINNGNTEEVKAIANDIIDNEGKINHHGKRAESIVKGMLLHSRNNTGIKELTDVNALVDEYLRLAQHGLRKNDKSFTAGQSTQGITIETNYDRNIGNIQIVPQEIGRVILNLLNNAVYAVAEKKKQDVPGYQPTIIISTSRSKGKVEIKIQDNGIGIPAKIAEKVFQPFFTTKPSGQGTGLGLSLSYDIIKAHGGELNVETPLASQSGKESEGAKFIITLPA